MKKTILALALVAGLTGFAGSAMAGNNTRAIITPADDVKFVPLNSTDKSDKGVLIHVVYGALNKKGPVAFLARLPDGFSAGWHSHSSDSYITVIKGTYREWCRGKSQGKAILPGGTVFMPANMIHNNLAEAKGGYTLTYSYWPNGFNVNK